MVVVVVTCSVLVPRPAHSAMPRPLQLAAAWAWLTLVARLTHTSSTRVTAAPPAKLQFGSKYFIVRIV